MKRENLNHRKDPSNQALGELNLLLREIVESGTPLNVKVISQSMTPLLQTGDTVVVEHTGQKDFHVGDMIVFVRNNELITHRLLVKKEKCWLTKGDNTLNPDPPLAPDHVLGKVIAIQRKNQTWQMTSSPWLQANRVLAGTNRAQNALIGLAKKITSPIFGENPPRGISILNKLLAFPFRLFSKLLIQFSVKRKK